MEIVRRVSLGGRIVVGIWGLLGLVVGLPYLMIGCGVKSMVGFYTK
jgi:hypothetical protein